MTSPLGFMAREQADYTITLDPLRNALTSLAMLSANPQDIDVEDWVLETAAALTPEQRHRNRLVFEGFGAALLPAQAYSDLRSYLSALEAMPAADLRDQLLRGLVQSGDQAAAELSGIEVRARSRVCRARGQPAAEPVAQLPGSRHAASRALRRAAARSHARWRALLAGSG
jgi:hypothetical protein